MEFSYFDQFNDMTIDLTDYLVNLSSSGFQYSFNNSQPVSATVKNLFDKFDIVFDFTKNINLILRYDLKDYELPEVVSNNVYGTPDFWWVILLFNNIKNPFLDWPLAQDQIVQVATNLFENEKKYDYQTYINFLTEINDEKKKLILPKPDTLKDIVWQYRQAILSTK